jgi:hypothetical protein
VERYVADDKIGALPVRTVVLGQEGRLGLHVVVEEEQKLSPGVLGAEVPRRRCAAVRLLQHGERKGDAQRSNGIGGSVARAVDRHQDLELLGEALTRERRDVRDNERAPREGRDHDADSHAAFRTLVPSERSHPSPILDARGKLSGWKAMVERSANDAMGTPYVSIVMSVFNGERFLREAIDSLLAQTFEDFELLVVDDGSTDRTSSILRAYGDPRLRTRRNAQNVGQAASLNTGLVAARGIYVARLDADDVAFPDRLDKQVAHLDANATTAMIGSAWIEIDASGRRGRAHRPPTACIDLRWRLLFSNAFLHSSVLVRRAALPDAAYDTTIGYGEDYELWSRVATGWEVANLVEPLVLYRHSRSSKTATIPTAQAQVDAIAGANIDRVAKGEFAWSSQSSAELAAIGRRLLLGREEVEPVPAVRVVRDLLQLQEAFARFFELTPREAQAHRARVSSTLAARLRSIGRARRDPRAWRSGAALLAGTALRDPGILVRRHGHG